ncbi:class I SAM-dependent methyltransferase [Glycomyces paridis]|uniref:Class I SAM-dependent methyltransferase n=1 Tax=Glycomyces paridis TaxID=2126555 RepID=A0A4S8NWL3_9ACTN|nr:class I SAM-dependent methyltransferase [Glycomyces paridis]THV22053.1 hypothetical protein E9998_23830 [Glycomyces paridis]
MSSRTDSGSSSLRHGVELTAYLVNESRARMPDLAGDETARAWIPETDRPAVRDLWDEYADTVYPHDDLVVSLRRRRVFEALAAALREDPDTVLVECGAGFSSYPWQLPFTTALGIDLPRIAEAKGRRIAELVEAGVLPERDVRLLTADLSSTAAIDALADTVREVAAGRPVAFLVEGMLYYLPPVAARALAGLGSRFGTKTVTIITYWPDFAESNRVLAKQRDWFRDRSIPEDATYFARGELPSLLGEAVDDQGPDDLQQRYMGAVSVPEDDLIPEYVAVTPFKAAP